MVEKTDWKTPLIVIGIILFAYVIFILIANPFKQIEKESLSDDDFKILSASWDDYELEWKAGEYVADRNRPIDWNKECDYCKTGKRDGIEYGATEEQRCGKGNYHLITDASRTLIFNAAIDELNLENLRDMSGINSGVIKNGTSIQRIISSYQGKLISNLDIRKSHEITLCAAILSEDNFICKSVTLPAKCSLN